MLKPTEVQLKAMMQLRGNTAFDTLYKWLEESLAGQSIKNNHAIGELAIKNSGRNLELEEILNYFEKTPEYLIQLKQEKACSGGNLP